MNATKIDLIAKKYLGLGVGLNVMLLAATLVAGTAHPEWPLTESAVLGFGFSLICLVTLTFVWRWMMKSHSDSMPTFYMAASGGRMLLALATLFVCFLIVGREAIAPYAVVFIIFYLLNVFLHSVYFSWVTNKLK